MIEILNAALRGLPSGGAYALVALGLVAVFRGTGIVNFAQASLGMFATYVFWAMYADIGIPLPLAIVLGLLAGVLVAAAFYLAVGRRLLEAPQASRILVTLGLLLALEAVVRLVWTNDQRLVSPFLVSGNLVIGDTSVSVLGLVLAGVAAAVAIALALLFNRTRFGRITTAFQDSAVGAQTLGYSPATFGLITWTIGGLLAGLAGILFAPISQLSPTALGSLLIPALGAALLAGFRRFWLALVVGLGTGVLESLSFLLELPAGFSKAIPYAVTLVAVVVAGRNLPSRGSREALRLFRVGSGKVRPLVVVLGFGLVLAGIFSMSSRWVDALTVSGIYAIVALGIVVSIGYTGQVILTPLAFAAVSLLVTGIASAWGAPMLAALFLGPLVVMLIGLLIGIPAVRVRGPGLTVGTIALAALIQVMVFSYEPLFNPPEGWRIGDTVLFGITVDRIASPERLAIVVWVFVLLAALSIASFRRSRAGRRLLATRADERAAAAAGVSVRESKIAAFAISSFFCGLGGSLLAFQMGTVSKAATGTAFSEFSWMSSLSLVALLVLAGVGYIFGGILTGLFTGGGIIMMLLSFSPEVNNWIALLFALNLVFVLAHQPDGIVGQILRSLPGRARRESDAPALPADRSSATAAAPVDASVLSPAKPALDRDEPVLAVRGLGLHYGGVRAVDDVSFEIRTGAVVGVLGPNGAGKSSLIDAITGFMPVDSGRVALAGADISGLAPHRRARMGLVRTFQDNLLFEDMTVRENLKVATDPKDTLAYLSGLAGIGRAERRDDNVVAAAAELAGVAHLLDDRVESLSLGWHARVTLARVLASRPTVLCLDEPAAALSAGARAEISAMIRTAAHTLGIAVLLVEHNIDVVLDACDEVVVMDRGRVIARGIPREVLESESVRKAYLGDLDPGESSESAQILEADSVV